MQGFSPVFLDLNLSERRIPLNTKEIIKELVRKDSNVSSVAELERKLDIANGTINKWDKSAPGTKALEKIADYFNVTVDFLLGRSLDNEFIQTEESNDEFVQFFRSETSDLTEEEKGEMVDSVKEFLEFRKSQLLKRRK